MACKNAISGKGKLRIVAPNIRADAVRVAGTISVKPAIQTRESVDGVGFSLNELNAYVEAEIYDNCGLSLLALSEICGDATMVTVELANGKAYSLSEVFVVGDVATNTEGTITLRFESAISGQEVLAC